jgi:hypothetical protein
MELLNFGLKLSIKNFPSAPSAIVVFSHAKKVSALNFFYLDIENPLGIGTLA